MLALRTVLSWPGLSTIRAAGSVRHANVSLAKADRIASRLARDLGVAMSPAVVETIHKNAVRRTRHECE
eukprot:6899724-Alexandrium_andersonii.AAC.1